MKQQGKTTAIIAAAGLGKRMGSGIPKQYLHIGGEPMLLHTLRAFEEHTAIDAICIVTNEEYIPYCRELTKQYGLKKAAAVVAGGRERQDSVFCALQEIKEKIPETEWVLIHDGARPFVTREIIDRVAAETKTGGAAVACVPVKDSIRQQIASGSGSAPKPGDCGSADRESGNAAALGSRNLPRELLFAVQTPQGFRMDLIWRAYEKAFADGFYGTDDASLVERLGHPVQIVPGAYSNYKVTTKEDLPMETRVGTGYDVHRLTEGRKLILGGVEIPFDRGLLGHSDADVLTHAVMDALLGAAAMGDIGRHFPDTDEKYRGISSMALLAEVRDKLADAGCRIGNLDITLIAQKPKISPYIEAMTKNLAETLQVEPAQINIKGTTTEKLGFEGRGEGIAAQAVCLLYR